jgi:hypothetical protein
VTIGGEGHSHLHSKSKSKMERDDQAQTPTPPLLYIYTAMGVFKVRPSPLTAFCKIEAGMF